MSSSLEAASDKLRNVCQSVLRTPIDTLVKNEALHAPFLAELKHHLDVYPDDYNFYVVSELGTGFGFAVCLEEGCGGAKAPILLRQNRKEPDGGKKAGLGSLFPYRTHIEFHPTHKTSRKSRLCNQSASKTQSVPLQSESSPTSTKLVKRSSLPGVPLKPRASTANNPMFNAPSSSEDSSISAPVAFNVKREPMDVDLLAIANPRRRSRQESVFDDKQLVCTPTKKPKLEQTNSLGLSQAQHVLIDLNDKMPQEELKKDTDEVKQELRIIDILGECKRKNTARDAARNRETLRKAAHEKRRNEMVYPRLRETSPTVRVKSESGDSSSDMDYWNLSAPSSATSFASSDSASALAPVKKEETKKEETKDADIEALMTRSQNDMPSCSRVQVEGIRSAASFNQDRREEMMQHNAISSSSLGPNDINANDGEYDTDEGDSAAYNYEGRSGFSQEDIRNFLKNAGHSGLKAMNKTLAARREQLGLSEKKKKYAGMTLKLLPHQIMGVGWMLDQEKGPNQGGILADEMGLGKTVQMIAVMLGNRSEDPAFRTTLVVAPVSLLKQWKNEIERISNHALSVFIHHGKDKAKHFKQFKKYDVVITSTHTLANEGPDYLANRKRVTRRSNGFIASDSEEEERTKPRKNKKKSLGPLMKAHFYRIVIDEAQNIRNKSTRISLTADAVNGKYRWCLTGTPIINHLEDAFGLIRFLKLRPFYDWTAFRSHIACHTKKYPNLAMKRLQGIFGTCLLRRTKNDELDGKPLIILTPKNIELVKLEFSPEEREIYKQVETKNQITFNKYLRQGTVLKNYHHVLTMLLRLRQICSHSVLIAEDGIYEIDEEGNGNEDTDQLRLAMCQEGAGFVEKLRAKLKAKALALIEAEKSRAENAKVDDDDDDECPICYDNLTDAMVTSCMHIFCKDCINQHIGNSGQGEEVLCPSCRSNISSRKLYNVSAFEPTDKELGLKQEPEEGKLGVKEEVKEEEVIDIDNLARPSSYSKTVKDEDDDMEEFPTTLCAKSKGKGKAKAQPRRSQRARRSIRAVQTDSDEEAVADHTRVADYDSSDEDFLDSDLSDFIVEDGEDEEEKDKRRDERKRLRKLRPVEVEDEEEEKDEATVIQPRVRRGRGRGLPDFANIGPVQTLPKTAPSTKMKYMMDKIERVARDHPDEKTMVLSQWTKCLDIVDSYLHSKNIRCERYQGSMTREERDAAVSRFMNKERCSVMLMSLKAGGVGLNLTRANRVINLDLGWSEAVESQAFDRVHRLGQERPVFVDRLVIKDTVEDRVLALQQQKKAFADGSLGEGTGVKLGRLNVRQLANLFGLNEYGERI